MVEWMLSTALFVQQCNKCPSFVNIGHQKQKKRRSNELSPRPRRRLAL